MSTFRIRFRPIFPLVFLSGMAACHGAINEQGARDVERGRLYAETNCATCHAVGEMGDSPYAPAPPFRTLSQNYPLENLAEAFAEGIGVGHSGDVQMPEFILSPNEIDDLLTYMTTLQE